MSDISAEDLARARRQVIGLRQKGRGDAEIDAWLQKKYGIGIKDVEHMGMTDYGRAAAQGLTLGFGDELAGAGAALAGGSYTKARDQVRENAAAARATAPKTMMGTELAGAMIPAFLTGGAAGAGVGGAMLGGAAFGAAEGLGHAEGGPLQQAESTAAGGLLGAGLGGAGKLAGAAVRKGGQMFMPKTNVLNAAARVLPPDAAQTMARQETLAPGTAVPAALSPEMTALARGVGADAKAGVQAVSDADARRAAIKAAMTGFDARYSALEQPLKVDADLRAILGRAGSMPPGDEIMFSDLQHARTIVNEKLRAAIKTGTRGSEIHRLGGLKGDLDEWMQARVPGLKQVDSDYAFLSKSLKGAKDLQKQVTASTKNYAANAAYGGEAGSIGGSLPSNARSLTNMLGSMLSPDRAARARAVQSQLLTPSAPMKGLLDARAGMMAPDPSMSLGGGLQALPTGLLGPAMDPIQQMLQAMQGGQQQ